MAGSRNSRETQKKQKVQTNNKFSAAILRIYVCDNNQLSIGKNVDKIKAALVKNVGIVTN